MVFAALVDVTSLIEARWDVTSLIEARTKRAREMLSIYQADLRAGKFH
jgi:hypothetical protein